MAQQSESTRRIHRWMGALTAMSVTVPVAFFCWALYLSVNWQRIDPLQIPIGWLIFVTSGALPIFLFGLHAVFVRAFPATALRAMASQLVTGSRAVAYGVGLMVTAAAIAAFWGLFAHSVATLNWALLEQLGRILGIVAGVGAAITAAPSVLRQLSRTL
jgi:hypothetical protein